VCTPTCRKGNGRWLPDKLVRPTLATVEESLPDLVGWIATRPRSHGDMDGQLRSADSSPT
jgi:hypothetical protein